jgi:hypothetical protein
MGIGFSANRPQDQTGTKVMDPSMEPITAIAGITVHKVASSLVFKAGMEIDADGSPHAYHPISNKGLDSLDNAKDENGRFVGIAVGHGGQPFVQGEGHPAPGFYVSTTSLQDTSKDPSDPTRYVDSETIPFLVLPGHMTGDAKIGDFAVLIHTKDPRPPCFAICADTGPHGKIGEASIAAAKALGIPPSPRSGGTEAKEILYIVFAGSGNGKPRSLEEINVEGARLFADWGGLDRVDGLFA